MLSQRLQVTTNNCAFLLVKKVSTLSFQRVAIFNMTSSNSTNKSKRMRNKKKKFLCLEEQKEKILGENGTSKNIILWKAKNMRRKEPSSAYYIREGKKMRRKGPTFAL